MFDIEKIQKLIDMMVAHDLVEISLRDGDVEVNLRRPHADAGNGMVAPMMIAAGAGMAGAPITEAVSTSKPEVREETDTVDIRSPMVGTFYISPDPESPAYVKIGSAVQADTVVCIVEAMKVFNEIKAEVDGVIERVLVQNEQSVEYGQPLFRVKPV